MEEERRIFKCSLEVRFVLLMVDGVVTLSTFRLSKHYYNVLRVPENPGAEQRPEAKSS